jgi:hypothetical protein
MKVLGHGFRGRTRSFSRFETGMQKCEQHRGIEMRATMLRSVVGCSLKHDLGQPMARALSRVKKLSELFQHTIVNPQLLFQGM